MIPRRLAFSKSGVGRSKSCNAGNSPPMWCFRFRIEVAKELNELLTVHFCIFPSQQACLLLGFELYPYLETQNTENLCWRWSMFVGLR